MPNSSGLDWGQDVDNSVKAGVWLIAFGGVDWEEAGVSETGAVWITASASLDRDMEVGGPENGDGWIADTEQPQRYKNIKDKKNILKKVGSIFICRYDIDAGSRGWGKFKG